MLSACYEIEQKALAKIELDADAGGDRAFGLICLEEIELRSGQWEELLQSSRLSNEELARLIDRKHRMEGRIRQSFAIDPTS